MAKGTELKEKSTERVIGRYAIYDEIASGGMAVVHIGRMLGQAGFSRTVAVKRLHPQFAKNPNFVSMFLDEARLSVRVQHPNVVAPLDVLVVDGEVLVVMEYVAGDTLSRLQRSVATKEHPPTPAVIVGIMTNALYGLHAAHEALGEDGTPLHIVHRDVSPQNIMVGMNGMARVLDFGVAKAAVRSQCTTNGEVKGKLAYMAPEQVEGASLDRRTDIFAAGVVAWESLARHRLFSADQASETMARILRGRIPPPSKFSPAVSPELDQVVLKALQRDPKNRYQTAREFAVALERVCGPATPSEVGDWVKSVAGDELAARAERVAAIETQSSSSIIRPLQLPPRISETVPVRVPAPQFDSDARLQRSQSRITMPLVNEVDARFSVVSVARPSEAEAETPHLASPKKGGLPLKSRFALAVGGSLVLVSSTLAVLLVGVPSKKAHQPPTSTPLGSSAATATVEKPTLATLAPVAKPLSNSSAAIEPTASNSASEASVSTATSLTSVTTAKKNERKKPSLVALPTAGRSAAQLTQTNASNRAAPAKSQSNCSPPYVVDSKGIRRLRPECM